MDKTLKIDSAVHERLSVYKAKDRNLSNFSEAIDKLLSIVGV